MRLKGFGVVVMIAVLGAACTKSEAGSTGPEGPAGPEGPMGPQGPAGAQGATGPAGAPGASVQATTLEVGDETCPLGGTRFEIEGMPARFACNGVPGAQGPQGEMGPSGAQGLQGESVVATALVSGDAECPHGGTLLEVDGGSHFVCNGAPGAIGPQGEAGPQGLTGAQGARGETGPQGPTGAQGPQGLTGMQGPQGPTGAQGPQGLTGAQGPQGELGPQGPTGAQGPRGETGPQGVTGAQGPAGPTSVANCPANPGPVGFTQLDSTHSTLCVLRDPFLATWDRGEEWCGLYYSGATICTHRQMRRACKSGGLVLTTGTWLADRVGDNQALFVNSTACDDFDGVATTTNTQPATYCCLEWMKY